MNQAVASLGTLDPRFTQPAVRLIDRAADFEQYIREGKS